jgi:parvulin-like peptidyl-prolyl isomerase
MPTPTLRRPARRRLDAPRAGLFLALLAHAGCAGPPRDPAVLDTSGLDAADRSVRRDAPAGPPAEMPFVAVLDARQITWADLHRRIGELAGAAVLEEVVLDRLLQDELARAGIAVGPGQVEAERRMLAQALARGQPDADAGALLEALRRERGLGPARYEALLARSAALRALVAPRITVTDEDVSRLHEVRHGERRRARIIVVGGAGEASRIRADLAPGPSRADFADAAIAHSRDESALRGGLLEPISPADPAYPIVLRRALAELEPGQTSGVLALETGFAIVRMEEVIPPDGTLIEDVSEALALELRGRMERARMDELARRLVRGASLTILDPGVAWSWRVTGRGE